MFLFKRVVMLGLILIIQLSLLFSYKTIAQASEFSFQIDDQGLILQNCNEFQPDESLKYVIAPLLISDFDGYDKISLRELYLDWQTAHFGFSAGRRIITFGPGRYGYPILGPLCRETSFTGLGNLSQELRSEGYDQVGYNFSWGKLKYQKFYALVSEQGYRGLLGQRASYEWGNVSFGLSETAVVNETAPWYYYNPLPFVPVYFDQFLGIRIFKIQHINDAANVNVAADVTWKVTPEFRIYGEYYADDRPGLKFFQHNDLEVSQPWENPWRVGYQAGLEWKRAFSQPDLALYSEYTRIDQYTYTGLNQELSYTYEGRIIGDPLGPDADRLNLELVSNKADGWQWGIALNHERHGEGKIGDVWHAVPGQTEVFLTGVVENTDRVDFNLSKIFGPVRLSATLGYKHIDNFDHILGAEKDGINLKVAANYKF